MKKLLMMVVLGSIALVSSMTASADFVKFYDNPKNGNRVLINMKSIQHKKGKNIAWCRKEFGDPVNYKGFSSVELKLQADCKLNKLSVLQTVGYKKQGNIRTTDANITELLLYPGTPNFMAFKIICGQRTPEQTLKNVMEIQSNR